MIQIDMDMPNSCQECPIWGIGDRGFICNIKGALIDSNMESKRPDWCPLKEVSINYMNGFTRPTRNIWEKSQ